MDENLLWDKAVKHINNRLELAKYNKALLPYIEMVEFGIRQGMLDENHLKRCTRGACLDVITLELSAVSGHIDTETYNACRELAVDITKEYFEDAIATQIKVVFMCLCHEEIAALVDCLKANFGERSFEVAQNQYELEKMVKPEQPDTLSI